MYLVEQFPGAVLFDLSDRAPSALKVWALVGGSWSARGELPIAARPRIAHEPGGGPRGMGSGTYFAELTLRDIDGDGLADVQLDDGQWVGFDRERGIFVTK